MQNCEPIISRIIPTINQKKNTLPKSKFYQFFRKPLTRFIHGCILFINAFDCRALEYFRDPVSANSDGTRFYSLRYAVREWTGDPCHPPPLDPRCSVEIPTWSSAEFKVPREHRRSCEMIGFRSVDHPNDSVEPCFLPCVSAHMDFCVPDRQCDLTDRIYVKLIFLIFPPILPRIENERWVRTELDTTKLATFNS